MNEIRRDPSRGAKIPRRMVCFSTEGKVPVNEIPMDPGRQGLTMKVSSHLIGEYENLLKLVKLEKMAENGDIRPARDAIAKMGVDISDAANAIASGILKNSKNINLEDVFPEIKTCPSNFHLA